MKPFFGLLVPFLDFLGVSGDDRPPGRSRLSIQPRAELTNHFGDVHGGVLATMLDVAMSSAARAQYPQAAGVVTVDLSVQFLSAGRGAITAEGRVVKAGRTTAFCDAEVRAEDGEVIARAMGTFVVRDHRAST